jgi:CheY-like chemotaxis protein
VVIIDVRLPCLDGVQLIRDITAISGAYVIVYTTALPEEGIVSVLRSGAKAIVFKDQPASVLVSCVRQVFTAPEVLTAETSSNMSVLTRREQEVAECAAATWDLRGNREVLPLSRISQIGGGQPRWTNAQAPWDDDPGSWFNFLWPNYSLVALISKYVQNGIDGSRQPDSSYRPLLRRRIRCL